MIKNPVLNTVLLFQLLKDEDISMIAFGKKIDYGQGHLGRIKSGEVRNIRCDGLYKIARYFNRPMEDFIIDESKLNLLL